MRRRHMRELNMSEVEAISGAGMLRSWVEDIKWTIGELPGIYESLIHATTDMICIGTGDC
jgi:hypothetical protein